MSSPPLRCLSPLVDDRGLIGPQMTTDTVLQGILRHDRLIIIAALSLLTVLAWADLVWLANDMSMGGMDMTGFRMIPAGQGLMMPASAPWQPIEFGYVFAMWTVMMIGMMTPSAAPMILIYARVGRQAASSGQPFAASSWFAAGYLLAWTAFSLVATSAQWALERAALLTPMMHSASDVLGGSVLIAAGLYQWTPVKEACLSYCQAPLTFILRHGGFRREATGALTLGFRHGLYCIGCCWALMALLFVGGIMNLFWIAALAVLVLAEKVIPFGRIVARLAGLAFVAGGVLLLVQHA
jgi:predicted metal-binding membrane protein